MPEFDFGHFHVLQEIGRGGMALVYKAVDTRNDETVALKILYPHLMSDENTIKRFKREAQVASRLQHKFIVPVIDFGEYDNQIYIAMRYMSGNSLSDLFKEPRSIKMKGIVRILSEVASALDYAHSKGVVHRDLKLQNILLDDQRHAYLSDFGIARLVDGTRLTATGQVAGTPMYMSPEQIRGRLVDYRSDIYSFSVMAYLLLTGFYPFTGEDSLSIVHKHVKEFPPTPTEVNPDLPETVNTVLLRGLMKDPDDRFDTTMEMVKALYQAVNLPQFHKTTTQINVYAINPIDSVEMDAIGNNSGNRVQSPTNAQAVLQSDLSSQVISAQQTVQSNGSRVGIFGLGFIALAFGLIIISLIFVLSQGNNSENTQALINNAQTQTKREAEFDQTATAFAIVSSDENGENNEVNELNDTPIPTDEPTATITPTPTATMTDTLMPTATLTPTQAGFPGSNGQILSPNGANVVTNPSPSGTYVGTIPNETYIQVIGRTGRNDFLEVVTEGGIQGFVSILQIDTDLEIELLPITFTPPDGPPDNERGTEGRPPPQNSGG